MISVVEVEIPYSLVGPYVENYWFESNAHSALPLDLYCLITHQTSSHSRCHIREEKP